MYKSGLPIVSVFDSIYNSSKNTKIKSLCSKILQGIQKGLPLKEAMKSCTNAIGSAYTMLVIAGEESGQLIEVLSNINKNIALQEKVKNDIISKMTYPTLMFFLAIFVALLFQTFVVKILQLKISGESFCVTSLAINALFQICFVFLIIAGIIFYLYKNRYFLANLASSLFIFGPIGNIIKNYTFSNFFSILSLSYGAGFSLAESLYLATSVIKIPDLEKKLKKSAFRVQQGCELTTALSATSLFSDYAISQIATGEQAGNLEKTLKNIADDYSSQLEVSLGILLKILEPLMTVIVGLVVLYTIVSSYNAYYSFIFKAF